MTLRDRIEYLVFLGRYEGWENSRIADAILADPEIAAQREVAEAAAGEVAAERAFDPALPQRRRRAIARQTAAATKRKHAALARLEEASRG